MTELEKLKQWLETWSGWQGALQVDYTQEAPVACGLFPLGVEERFRRRDVTGTVTVGCRCRFLLCRVCPGQAAGQANAQWLLELQSWVREQSSLGLAPVFGDDPEQEQLRAEQGRLKDADQTGTGVYTVQLTAEYIKRYE